MSYTYRCPSCELEITSSEPLPTAATSCPRCGRLVDQVQSLVDVPPPETCPHGVELTAPDSCPYCHNLTTGALAEASICPEHGGNADRGKLLAGLLGSQNLYCPVPAIREGLRIFHRAHWWAPGESPASELHQDPGAGELHQDPSLPRLAPAPDTGEGPAEHVRNALQILTGLVDYDGTLTPVSDLELHEAIAGIVSRLYWAHQHADCDDRAKYEIGVALGQVNNAIAIHPTDPAPESTRRDALQLLRFRLNAALVHQGDPIDPDPEQLQALGIERRETTRGQLGQPVAGLPEWVNPAQPDPVAGTEGGAQ